MKGKGVKSKEKDKIPHPQSRQAKRDFRKELKKTKKVQAKKDYIKEKQPELAKLQYFKAEVELLGKEEFSIDEIRKMISRWISRFDGELRELDKGPRKNKELILKSLVHAEMKQFEDGIFVGPDLTNKVGVKAIKDWLGELKTMHHVPTLSYQSQAGELTQQLFVNSLKSSSSSNTYTTTTTTTTSSDENDPLQTID